MLRIPRDEDRGEESFLWLRDGRVERELGEAELDGTRVAVEGYRRLLRGEVEDGFRRDGAAAAALPVPVPGSALAEARSRLSSEARALFEERVRSLRHFHARSLPATLHHVDEDGMRIRLVHRPLPSLGILLPRHRSVSLLLSLAVPAQVAGVERIIVAVEPERGGVAPGLLAACDLLGIYEVLPAGGAAGALALGLGTAQTPGVALLIGEDGDEARRAMAGLAGHCVVEPIDSVGDLVVLSDGQGACPDDCAAELMAHLELGGSGLRACLATSEGFVAQCAAAIERTWVHLGRTRQRGLNGAVGRRLRLLELRSLRRGIELIERLAPGRLHLCVHSPHKLLGEIRHVGQVHVGREAAPSRALRDGLVPVLPSGVRGSVPTPARFLEPIAAYRGAEAPGVAADRSSWQEFEKIPD
ncbi:MAG: histidinol dehydrogenase [Planctomycetota bacterium]